MPQDYVNEMSVSFSIPGHDNKFPAIEKKRP